MKEDIGLLAKLNPFLTHLILYERNLSIHIPYPLKFLTNGSFYHVLNIETCEDSHASAKKVVNELPKLLSIFKHSTHHAFMSEHILVKPSQEQQTTDTVCPKK